VEKSLPVALEEAAAVSAGGKLYVIGGFDAAGNSLRTVWVFDGNVWKAGARLPLGLDHSSAAELGGRLYVAGGHSFGRDSAAVYRLDGASWTPLASMHHARGGHALLVATGRLYVLGGNSAAANIAPAEVYDPKTGSWHDLSALPVLMCAPPAAELRLLRASTATTPVTQSGCDGRICPCPRAAPAP